MLMKVFQSTNQFYFSVNLNKVIIVLFPQSLMCPSINPFLGGYHFQKLIRACICAFKYEKIPSGCTFQTSREVYTALVSFPKHHVHLLSHPFKTYFVLWPLSMNQISWGCPENQQKLVCCHCTSRWQNAFVRISLVACNRNHFEASPVPHLLDHITEAWRGSLDVGILRDGRTLLHHAVLCCPLEYIVFPHTAWSQAARDIHPYGLRSREEGLFSSG